MEVIILKNATLEKTEKTQEHLKDIDASVDDVTDLFIEEDREYGDGEEKQPHGVW